MKKQVSISDAELPIMKVLWEKGELASPEIFAGMEGNISTLKTLLKRLVQKGAVKAAGFTSRTYRYSAIISEEEYIRCERAGFLQKVFDGSREKMLLNFVKEEHLTRDDLEKLIQMIEEE